MFYTSHVIKSLLVALALVFATAACDGSVGPQGPQGDQGDPGEQGEQGEPGEDGNANVTRYIFDGHDFSSESEIILSLELSQSQTEESTWLVYLERVFGAGPVFYHVPGEGWAGDLATYDVRHRWIDPTARFTVAADGSGSNYDSIHIVRIEDSNVEDCTGGGCLRSTAGIPELPVELDVSDYHAVMDYYGLSEEDAIRL